MTRLNQRRLGDTRWGAGVVGMGAGSGESIFLPRIILFLFYSKK
jgi:hypothetical protein